MSGLGLTVLSNLCSQPVVCGQLPGGPRAKTTFIFFKDISTQADQFCQFSMAQFPMVFCDREAKFVVLKSQTVENRWSKLCDLLLFKSNKC